MESLQKYKDAGGNNVATKKTYLGLRETTTPVSNSDSIEPRLH